jgi:hypothetical protein
VATRAAPKVTAEDGMRVMELSEKIVAAMETESAA